MNPSVVNVVIPFLDLQDNSDRDPQMITYREPNTSVLRIDSRIRRDPQSEASSIVLSTSTSGGISNPLIKSDIRRICIKKVEFFFYPDNVIYNYNDTLEFDFVTLTIPHEHFTIQLDAGVYTVEELGQEIADKMQDWFDGQSYAVTVDYTYIPPEDGNSLDGQIKLQLDGGINSSSLSINPDCTFCKYGSFSLNSLNSWPTAYTNLVLMSFYSVLPFPYIDIASNALTQDQKIVPTNTSYSNNDVIYRMFDLRYGENLYIETAPTAWLNINNNKSIYSIDLTFLDGYGNKIPSIKSRDCNIRMEILCQR